MLLGIQTNSQVVMIVNPDSLTPFFLKGPGSLNARMVCVTGRLSINCLH